MDNPQYNSNSGNDSRNRYVKRSSESQKRRTTDASSRQSVSQKKNESTAKTSRTTRSTDSRKTAVKTSQNFSNGMTPEMIKAEKKKAARKKMILNNIKNVGIILVIVVAISASIAAVGVSCIKDVLAVNISEKDSVSVSVVIEEGMDTNDVINVLSDAGVIKNGWFCKLAAKFIGYSDEGYIARTYEFNRSMGLENMLNEIKAKSSTAAKTVTLTFPEGYTSDQIIDMLAENNVCSREKLIDAINTTDFSADFNFLKNVPNKSDRYNWLEGYLFPDTYEFYIGESAVSVIKKFLNNFDSKWTDNYSEKAEALELTIDQVIRLASIVEKEAVGSDMSIVASVMMNRIDAGMRLECDSTGNYIAYNTTQLTQQQIETYNELYNTYVCGSLPVGAICNPGVDAIEAVLNAPDTSYYYFIHDANNELRVAKSLSEHENNIANYGLAN